MTTAIKNSAIFSCKEILSSSSYHDASSLTNLLTTLSLLPNTEKEQAVITALISPKEALKKVMNCLMNTETRELRESISLVPDEVPVTTVHKKFNVPEISSRKSVTVSFDGDKKEFMVTNDSQSIEDVHKMVFEMFQLSPVSQKVIYKSIPQTGELLLVKDLESINDGDALKIILPGHSHGDSLRKYLDKSFRGLSLELKDLKKLLVKNNNLTNLDPNGASSKTETRIRKLSDAERILNTSKNITSSPNKNQQIINKHTGEIQQLRKNLSIIRQMFKNCQNEVNTTMTNMLVQSQKVRSLSSNNSEDGRQMLLSAKKRMEENAESISNRVHDMQDIVDELKSDVIVRKCKLSGKRLDILFEEAENVKTGLDEFTNFVNQVRPTWKTLWEKELQCIVKEQGFLKRQDQISQDLAEGYAESFSILNTIKQLSRLQQESVAEQPVLHVWSPDEIKEGGINGLLTEIKLTGIDSEKRLQAFERNEKLRKWKLEQEKKNPFEKELEKFVSEGKLKMTGGFEESDRLLERKSKSFLQ